MSWTASGTVVDGEVEISVSAELSEESNQQVQATGKAVAALVKSGALGDPDAKYYVSVSGHANPEHEPVAGWSNDHVTISVSQASKEES